MALVPKLLYFVIERAAEPVSNRLETFAASSPRFRSFCLYVARWQADLDYHKSLRRIAHLQRLADGQGQHPIPGSSAWTPVDDLAAADPRPELSEREATAKGSEILGEFIVLSVGLGLLVHQAASGRSQEMEQAAQVERNEERIRSLERALDAQRDKVHLLEQRLEDATRRPWWAWIWGPLRPRGGGEGGTP